MIRGRLFALIMVSLIARGNALATPTNPMPALHRVHGAEQLFVDGKPFLVRGGELGNSSASSLAYLKPFWPKLVAMNLNTVIAPVYWELIEPQPGRFDFSSVDGLLAQARQSHMRLVLLWFGSWKNSMSSYVPGWIKRDEARFPRAKRSDGSGMEILSPASQNNVEADAAAFAVFMAHLKAADSARHTVIMVQVENEIGMIPEARDHSA
ncbi:MAG TPA: beta-galactosidase, partial [Rhizomicrobium sp.]|nr:beta-galactosidase [Rhizomicrobium sp.]